MSKTASEFTGNSTETCPQGWKIFQTDLLTSRKIAVAYPDPDDERVNSFETCTANKNCGIKLFVRIVHLVGHLHIAI